MKIKKSVNMSMFSRIYPAIKTILFSIEAEKAHTIALKSLKKSYECRLIRSFMNNSLNLPKKIMGLDIKNPIGLAAGLDKNGEYIDALGNLGFGFIEVGTVTPYPQTGNPKPRIFRIPEAESIINRLGFNNDGIEKVINNITNSTWRNNNGKIGINIGKNAKTEIKDAANDYLLCFEKAYKYADYITINVSSPNTKHLRNLQNKEYLENLLTLIKTKQNLLSDLYSKYVPIALKISPDLTYEEINIIGEIVIKNKIDGVIATNTTTSRKTVEIFNNSQQTGGLSGNPLHQLSLNVIKQLKSLLGEDISIIGTGGITSAANAKATIKAGANAIQIYTGFIYKGPGLINECLQEIKDYL